MKGSEWKIGDRVRYTGTLSAEFVGHEGEIIRLDRLYDGSYSVGVRFDKTPPGEQFGIIADNLTVVTADTYKTGDVVLVEGVSGLGHKGKLAVIDSVHTRVKDEPTVDIGNGDIYNLTFDDDSVPGKRHAVWESHIKAPVLGDIYKYTSDYGDEVTGALAEPKCTCCKYVLINKDGGTETYIGKQYITRGRVSFVKAKPEPKDDTIKVGDTVEVRGDYANPRTGAGFPFVGEVLAARPHGDGDQMIDVRGRRGCGVDLSWRVLASLCTKVGSTEPTLTKEEGGTMDSTTEQNLRDEVARLRRALSTARAAHEADIAKIGEALIEEAEERDWCSDFDNFVDGLNGRLTYNLPEREREFTVTFTVQYITTVTARDSDAASELVAEDWSSYVDSYSASFDDVNDVEEN